MTVSIALKKRQESQENLLLQRNWVSGAELQPGESQNGGLEMFGRWFALRIRWFQGSSRYIIFRGANAFEANQIHVSVQCHRSPELTKDEVGSSQCLTMSWNMSINLTTVDRQIKREPVCWQLHFKLKTQGINKRHGYWAWYPGTKTKIYQTSNGDWTSYLLKVNRHRYSLTTIGPLA